MPPPPPARRPDLDALRGLAILLVVGYHAGVRALSGGFVAVDVFFVLSGYFAVGTMLREYAATGRVAVPTFWARRARRLLPPLAAVVAATLAAVWSLYPPIDRAAVAEAARDVALGVPNVAFARRSVDYFAGGDSPFLHTWSLGVELQVSLALPLVFLLLAWLGARGVTGSDAARRTDALLRGVLPGLVVIAAASFAWALRLAAADPSRAYFDTAARAWEFAAGGVLALLVTQTERSSALGGRPSAGRWAQVLGVGVIVASALLLDDDRAWPAAMTLVPVLGVTAIVAAGARDSAVFAGEDVVARTLRWLGGLSYAWYLWHWPVIVLAGELSPGLGVGARLAWSVAALVPAWLTHRWIERPARRSEGSANAFRWLAGSVTACVAIAVVSPPLRAAAERRASAPDQRRYAQAREDRLPHQCWGADPRGPLCTFGDPKGRVTVVLMGDSHAEHWLAAVDRLGRERGWRVVPFVNGGCPVSAAPELVRRRRADRDRECATWREAAVRRIVALRPAAAILSSWDEYMVRDRPRVPAGRSGHVAPDAWRRGLGRTYARIASAGIPVVALRGTPFPAFDVPACLSRRAATGGASDDCSYRRDDAVHVGARAAHAAAVRDAAARRLPVAAVDMSDRVCPAARCGVERAGVVVFTDDNHLTARFTRGEAPVLGARVDAALRGMGARLP